MDNYTTRELFAEIIRRNEIRTPSKKRTFIRPRSEVSVFDGLALIYVANDFLEDMAFDELHRRTTASRIDTKKQC